MVTALTGCPSPQTAGTPPAEPTPAPSASPEPPQEALEIEVRELALDANGQLRLELEAPEALVVMPLIEPQRYFMRMDEAPIDTLPAYRTAGLKTLSMPPVRRAPAPAPRAMEAPEGYGQDASFQVGAITVDATRAFESPNVLIYVDKRDAATTAAKIQAIATAFETRLYPAITQLLGAAPGGRADGFNRGDDRVVLLMSRETSGAAVTFPDDLFPPMDDSGLSNHGKIIHLSPDATPEQLLPSLAAEYGGLVFLMQRLETYSRMENRNLPVGQDAAYFFDEATFPDLWLHSLMARLAMQVSGYSAETGDRDALVAVGKYLDLPSMYRLDMPALPGAYEDNAGQMTLFSAYLYGQKPDFAKGLGSTEALGAKAVALAMQRDFPGLFRDFSLATVLDGLKGVPARYSIPFVNLHQTYTLDGKPFPFAGAGARTPGAVGGAASYQTIALRGHFPEGKLRLGLSAGVAKKASLVLFRPSATARFIGE